MKNKILLVGAGPMSVDYSKVLKEFDYEVVVIGRGEISAAEFKKETGLDVVTGGLRKWLGENKVCLDKAIVAVTENLLGQATLELLEAGYKDILVEKPGGLNFSDIEHVHKIAKDKNAKVYVGYNRRFFASTIKAQELIKEDGGVTSFNFEFTEWGHVIKDYPKADGVWDEWFIQNSSHVVDMAFYLGGMPKDIKGFISGGSDWHPKASVFAGAGVSENGALFSYNANWESAGRWWVEILTEKRRLIMKPMEELRVQMKGSIAVEKIDIEDEFDIKFKPGLYKQVEAYLNDEGKLMKIEEQVSMLPYYRKMVNPIN
jgi:predicted dehydrogenase